MKYYYETSNGDIIPFKYVSAVVCNNVNMLVYLNINVLSLTGEDADKFKEAYLEYMKPDDF